MITAIIPARGGSLELPRKNLQIIDDGFSLVKIAVAQAWKILGKDDQVIVSTEDREIRQSLIGWCKVIDRPNELSQNETATIDVIKHLEPFITSEYMILLQPTHPFRDCESLSRQLKQFIDKKFECGFAAEKFDGFLFDKNGQPRNRTWDFRPRRQDKESSYIEDGSFYVFNRKVFEKPDFIWEGAKILQGFRGIDVHNKQDLEYARKLWSKSWLN